MDNTITKMDDDREQPWNFHKCKFCSYRSKSTFLMCKHVRLHRTKLETDTFTCNSKTPETLECEICVFETNLKVNLTEHIRVFHKEQEFSEEQENILKCYRCKRCHFETHSLLVLTTHEDNCKIVVGSNTSKGREHHEHSQIDERYNIIYSRGIKWFKCKHCQCKYRAKSSIKQHIVVKHTKSDDIKRFKCVKCSYKSKQLSYLRRHIIIKHINQEDIDWFKCSKCPYKSKYSGDLKRHVINKHTAPENVDWFKCSKCPYKSKYSGDLKRHVINKHTTPENVDWFKCTYCDYKCKQKVGLKAHITIKHANPEDINWFKCVKCSYKGKQRANLRQHILNKHINPEDIEKDVSEEQANILKCYRCKRCDFETHSLLVLTTHIDYCNIIVRSNSSERHEQNELSPVQIDKRYNFINVSGIRWFKCRDCKFKCKLKGNLKSHIMVKHTKSKDISWFKCPHCDNKFKRKGHLKAHITVNHVKPEDINWFKCVKCPYKSKLASYLRSHMLYKHTDPENCHWFKCTQCDYKSKEGKTLKRHVVGMHT